MKPRDSLKDLYEHLKRFHLSDALYVIGSVNAAFKYGTVTIDHKHTLLHVKEWLDLRAHDEMARRSIMINLTRMARFLLLANANDHKGMSLDLYSADFNNVFNLVVNLDDPDFDADDRGLEKFGKHFSRIGQYQFPLQASKMRLIGRGYLLFHILANKFVTDYDFDNNFKMYYNISILEFMTTGIAMWIMSDGALNKQLRIDTTPLEYLISQRTQDIFLSLSSGTPEQYRRLVRGEDWKTPDRKKDRWALDPFAIMPALIVERSSKISADKVVVPQPKFLLDRASSGIFYLLADKERDIALSEGKDRKNPFRKAFGTIYREYAGKQLSLTGDHQFVDLDVAFPHSDIKIPDFALIRNDTCILFEIKTSLLNIAARTYFEPTTLEIEIRKGNIKKAIDQLIEFKEHLRTGKVTDKRFDSIGKYVIVIIGYEDIFTLNSTLLPMMDSIYGTANELQFGCITDIESIGSAIENGIRVVDNILAKTLDPAKRQWAFSTTFSKMTDMSNSVLDHAYEEYMLRLGVPGAKGSRV